MATDALIESCSNIRSMTKDIYAPVVGESIQIGQQTNSFSVNISDNLLASLKISRVSALASCSVIKYWLRFMTVWGQWNFICKGPSYCTCNIHDTNFGTAFVINRSRGRWKWDKEPKPKVSRFPTPSHPAALNHDWGAQVKCPKITTCLRRGASWTCRWGSFDLQHVRKLLWGTRGICCRSKTGQGQGWVGRECFWGVLYCTKRDL